MSTNAFERALTAIGKHVKYIDDTAKAITAKGVQSSGKLKNFPKEIVQIQGESNGTNKGMDLVRHFEGMGFDLSTEDGVRDAISIIRSKVTGKENILDEVFGRSSFYGSSKYYLTENILELKNGNYYCFDSVTEDLDVSIRVFAKLRRKNGDRWIGSEFRRLLPGDYSGNTGKPIYLNAGDEFAKVVNYEISEKGYASFGETVIQMEFNYNGKRISGYFGTGYVNVEMGPSPVTELSTID